VPAVTKLLAVSVLCCAVAAGGGTVFGQSREQASPRPAAGDSAGAASDDTAQPPASIDDEVIVRGRTRADLRLQIKLAQDAVFARFNDINSTDDFDVHCRDEMLTGSRIPRRICQANFWRDAQANAGQETVHALQGGYAVDSELFVAEALYRRTQFNEEMRRLVREDGELKAAMARLANLEEAEAGGRLPRAALATASAEKTAGGQALPYDAAIEANVRMGRDPWSHTLRQRTFTIAHLYGRIRALNVKCTRRTERLRFELGAEWTLPDDWGTCVLRVDAPLGTTFTLYEFQ
jgi:hypothetical protein